MILSPYFWLAALLAALVFFGIGYHNGYKHATNHAEALQLQAVEKATEAALAQAKRDQQTAQKYETTRETIRTVYVKVKEKVHENVAKNPNYAECSLDADGLRLYNERPADAPPATSGTDSAVSESAGRAGWQTVDHTGEQSGASADVLRLPGAAQIISGMGGTGLALSHAEVF